LNIHFRNKERKLHITQFNSIPYRSSHCNWNNNTNPNINKNDETINALSASNDCTVTEMTENDDDEDNIKTIAMIDTGKSSNNGNK
jgi:hypothetical protein